MPMLGTGPTEETSTLCFLGELVPKRVFEHVSITRDAIATLVIDIVLTVHT